MLLHNHYYSINTNKFHINPTNLIHDPHPSTQSTPYYSTQSNSFNELSSEDRTPPRQRTLRHRIVMSSLRWIGWAAQKGVEYKMSQASGSFGMAAAIYRWIQHKRNNEQHR